MALWNPKRKVLQIHICMEWWIQDFSFVLRYLFIIRFKYVDNIQYYIIAWATFYILLLSFSASNSNSFENGRSCFGVSPRFLNSVFMEWYSEIFHTLCAASSTTDTHTYTNHRHVQKSHYFSQSIRDKSLKPKQMLNNGCDGNNGCWRRIRHTPKMW